MSVSVETGGKQYRPLVETCFARVVGKIKLFKCAQSGCLRDRVVGQRPAKKIPEDSVGDDGVLQLESGQLSVLPPPLRTLNVSPVSPAIQLQYNFLYN